VARNLRETDFLAPMEQRLSPIDAVLGQRQELPYVLSVRERRVLVPIARTCPFGCRYCYAEDTAIAPNDDVDLARVAAALDRLPGDSYDVIQLGYDGDPIASAQALTTLLPRLVATGKHVNISTKGTASPSLRAFLGEMHRATPLGMSLNVSATCWESAPEIEPRTPLPGRRLRTASALSTEYGIPFVLSLRPLLPSVPDSELFTLLDHARDKGAAAVVTGPLYVLPDGRNMAWSNETFDDVAPTRVTWSPAAVHYRRIEDSARIDRLRGYAESRGFPFHRTNEAALRQLMARTHG
jgi:DNA repair photolyase